MSEQAKDVILIVDDQMTVVRVLGRMLSDKYIVHVATDGDRALQLATEKLPDLILLDMVMPGLSGIEVCMKLKQDPLTENIPIIFVTSMDDRHNEAQGLKAGAVDYIPKPCSPEIVAARVAVHLAISRQTGFIERLAAGDISDADEIRALAQRMLSK